MVFFICDTCSNILKMRKPDSDSNLCCGVKYICIDCLKSFAEGQLEGHSSCVGGVEKNQESFKKQKMKDRGGNEMENNTTTANAIVTMTVPVVKGKKEKKKGSPNAIATPIANTLPIEPTGQPKPSTEEKKKYKKDKKGKIDKKSEHSLSTPEASFNPAPTAVESADNKMKKRKSASAEDTQTKKKRKSEVEKAWVSQEKLAELVGEEELVFEEFLERLEREVRSIYDGDSEEAVVQGLRIKFDGGKIVVSFKG
ncbi:hypothetical protein HOY82DRAFT_635829 [Tuber indicum]|nr:hypothetical protein HOY82DRAFT_635829 [Tuber indicum]